ncbi:hypothetical protein [Mesorhizobium sangaii]|uniref:Uncharacterized protein n=1 Tax=Mesorhizobium sangaii TaxID=505389 RepID=A0A841PC91_9HYPH|nr:hypothetical protein [Mesorhizobium sangaii]MBB6412776.1 hypothetical protein [Mesorhizobium sangaii]
MGTAARLPRRPCLRGRRLARAAAVALAASLMAAASVSEGRTCGYDSPQTVSQGFLNWLYPDSLYVVGAISREVAAGRLPLANFDQTGPDLFGHRFKLTAAALEQFGDMLRVASPGPFQASVSLVVVEPMLWTRFDQGPDGLRTTVHVSGAQPGDLVIVAGEAVIAEVAARRLTFGQAVERGVVRLYGPAPQIAQFLLSYSHVGANDSAVEISQKAVFSLVGAGAGSPDFASKQSHPVGITPAELGCTPDHTEISFHEGERQ